MNYGVAGCPRLKGWRTSNKAERTGSDLQGRTHVYIPAVMEYIELAGIHSGDSACVIPLVSISADNLATIKKHTKVPYFLFLIKRIVCLLLVKNSRKSKSARNESRAFSGIFTKSKKPFKTSGELVP